MNYIELKHDSQLTYLAQGKRLAEEFFNRNCVLVAQELIGTTLIWGNFHCIITETESYRGSDDPASHAFKGPTTRSSIMFGPPARVYVYLIYGMYHCLNIVTENIGEPSAILIRGLKIIAPEPEILNGPGKICRKLGITREHNNIDLATHPHFYLTQTQILAEFDATTRIGIRKGVEKLWRFIIRSPIV